MKTKKLAFASGIVGLAAGIFGIIGFILVATLMSLDETTGMVAMMLLGLVGIGLKIASIVLGIISLIQYQNDPRVNKAAGVLLIVGGALMIIPLISGIGNILLIVGGSLYLTSLKKFDESN